MSLNNKLISLLHLTVHFQCNNVQSNQILLLVTISQVANIVTWSLNFYVKEDNFTRYLLLLRLKVLFAILHPFCSPIFVLICLKSLDPGTFHLYHGKEK